MTRTLPHAGAILLLMLVPSVLTAQERPSPAITFPLAVPMVLPEAKSVASLPPAAPSLARHVTIGAAVGAGAGLAALGLVLLVCDEWCSHDRALAITLYTGGGAGLGAAAGALIWAVRR